MSKKEKVAYLAQKDVKVHPRHFYARKNLKSDFFHLRRFYSYKNCQKYKT